MNNTQQPLPAHIPAPGLAFPHSAGDTFAGSTITTYASSIEPSIKLADGRTATYYLEPALNGPGGTWHLRR